MGARAEEPIYNFEKAAAGLTPSGGFFDLAGGKPARMTRAGLLARLMVGAGWSSPVARQAHNLKVVGSNPTPATILMRIRLTRKPPAQRGAFRVLRKDDEPRRRRDHLSLRSIFPGLRMRHHLAKLAARLAISRSIALNRTGSRSVKSSTVCLVRPAHHAKLPVLTRPRARL